MSVDVWFPIYARDWLTGSATFAMTPEQKGMFVNLLCWAWLQDPPGTLPNDPALLAKMADTTLERWDEAGAPVRGQWEMGEDGRLRNPKLSGILEEAQARRERFTQRAQKAAGARWGNRDGQGDPPQEKAPPEPARVELPKEQLMEVVLPFRKLKEWAKTPQHAAALREALERVAALHGVGKLRHYAATCNAALEGMHGPQLKPEELRQGLEDWCATDNPGNPRSFRGFLFGAYTPPERGRGMGSGQRRGSQTVTPEDASKLWTNEEDEDDDNPHPRRAD